MTCKVKQSVLLVYPGSVPQALMVEPVIAADGHTYERVAIESWLQHKTTSPVTGEFLAHTRIVPNVLIRSAIETNQGR